MKTTLVVLPALLVAGSVAQAQTAPAAGAPQPAPGPIEEFLQKTKKPASWLSFGGDLRIRDEYLDSAFTLDADAANSEQNYQRFRARVWTTVSPVKPLDLNVRVTTELRDWNKPSYHAPPGTVTGWDWHEGIIDICNIKWKHSLNDAMTMTLTVGRQDIMLGDTLNWWLFADGTPLDGSRTFFLDAARLTFDLKDYKTTVDAIFIEHNAMNDKWLPPIKTDIIRAKPLTEQNERGAVLYVSNKSIAKTQADVYFVYKHDDYNVRANQVRAGDNANIFTPGGKVTGDITEHLRYSVEGAVQFGRRYGATANPSTAQDIQAFGVNTRLTYALKDSMNNQVRLSYECLSGDDRGTAGDYEQFDLLWGRWPRWSELYIYSYARETRVSQIGNIHRIGPGWSITPMKDLVFSADYNLLFADQKRPAAAAQFGTGGFRGHFIQSVLKYKFNAHLAGHLWAEFVWTGDYYAKRDLFTFLRAEAYLTW